MSKAHWGAMMRKAKAFGHSKQFKLGRDKDLRNISDDCPLEFEKELFSIYYVMEKRLGAWPGSFTAVQ